MQLWATGPKAIDYGKGMVICMFHILKETVFKDSKFEIISPVRGKCIPIDEVKDSVFASKLMGDGFAVEPFDNLIVSPADGEVVMIPDSRHAVGIKSKNGVEILIHIGIDTVNLNGEGFQALTSIGCKVKKGTPLISFDRGFMEQNHMDMTVMVVFTDGYNKEVNLTCYGREVKAGEILTS